MVAGGMRGCGGGHAWLWRGACVVGGMHGCGGVHGWGVCGCGGACVVAGGHAWLWGGMHRIRRDMVNERVVRILLECILVLNCKRKNFSECYASYDIYYIEKLVYLNFRKHHSLN